MNTKIFDLGPVPTSYAEMLTMYGLYKQVGE